MPLNRGPTHRAGSLRPHTNKPQPGASLAKGQHPTGAAIHSRALEGRTSTMTETRAPERVLHARIAADFADLARTGDLSGRLAQMHGTGGCVQPIHLTGYTSIVSAETGQLLHTVSSEDMPGGRLLTACGNRRETRCPSCSETYRADTYQVISAGLMGTKGVSPEVRDLPRLFLTVTAPSFGAVHGRPTTKTGKPRPCGCGKRHTEDAPELGTPLDPATYDYAGAVLWQAHATRLWARTMTQVRRELARVGGVTQRELSRHVRLSFAKVVEYQRRGLVHFHAVIRADGPGDEITEPPAWVTTEALRDALRAAFRSTVLHSDTKALGMRELAWGEQIDMQDIDGFASGRLTDRSVAAYIAKYATKSTTAGAVDTPLYCRRCDGFGASKHGRYCEECEGTGLRIFGWEDLDVSDHMRAMIRMCWDLGGLPEFAELKLRRWAHMLGFPGHFSTKSRRYSVTLGELRAARAEWRAEEAWRRRGLPDEGTTLVVGTWEYAGAGYTTAERLLASGVFHERMENRRAAREEAAFRGAA